MALNSSIGKVDVGCVDVVSLVDVSVANFVKRSEILFSCRSEGRMMCTSGLGQRGSWRPSTLDSWRTRTGISWVTTASRSLGPCRCLVGGGAS